MKAITIILVLISSISIAQQTQYMKVDSNNWTVRQIIETNRLTKREIIRELRGEIRGNRNKKQRIEDDHNKRIPEVDADYVTLDSLYKALTGESSLAFFQRRNKRNIQGEWEISRNENWHDAIIRNDTMFARGDTSIITFTSHCCFEVSPGVYARRLEFSAWNPSKEYTRGSTVFRIQRN